MATMPARQPEPPSILVEMVKAVPKTKNKLNRRLQPDNSQSIRFTVQIAFILLNIFLGQHSDSGLSIPGYSRGRSDASYAKPLSHPAQATSSAPSLQFNKMTEPTNWNSFARANASDRWRKQSAMMGTPLTELIVREARIESNHHVLDIASGTGEPAISIATFLNGSGEVTATDISAEPLKIAEGRAQERDLTNICFQVADVHALPFDEARFDRVTSRLGLMFFNDLPKALTEIHRVLRPGGRFTTVAWGPFEQPYFETTIGTILRLCPNLELPASGKAMFKFGETGVLSRALKEAGFAEAHDQIREVDWTWHGTTEDVWEYFQAVTVPFAPLLKSAHEESHDRINREVLTSIRKLAEGDSVHFGGQFVIASALKA